MNRLSFRARVFLLIFAVAAATAGATAWLTVRQTAQQVTESAALDQQDVNNAVDAITVYGLAHRSWNGVGGTVTAQAGQISQRVRLKTDDGTVTADSNPAAGPTPARLTVSLDTRPSVSFDDIYTRQGLRSIIAAQIGSYFETARVADCALRAGTTPTLATDAAGHRSLRSPGLCGPSAAPPPSVTGESQTYGTTDYIIDRCSLNVACLNREYQAQVANLTPPPAQVLVGSVDQPPPPPRISVTPALLVAGLVALVALAAALLISMRVLRPIGALAAASQRLGEGALDERVPVRGGDELAKLGRSFNRMAESLQRSKEQQHTMIGDIAHELRTPIANIRGYLEALQDGVFSPDQDLFRSLYEEALLQQRLIDDLQELALAEAGSLEYHPAPMDLAELLRAASIAHAAGTGVRIEVDAPEPVIVVADPDRFRQVTANLITNALRATAPDGMVKLRVSIDGGDALLQVADTGHGISREDLPHVFDRFWRADSARSRHTGGRGLGLAITREIVTAHEGTITVASAPGVGTVFTVRIPLAAEGL
ncbi:HAMP domain-containing sensor histidine kinase [Amycolatopsis minnesotensis]|uniref:histidine kinase n=1 Tax=Amycolatopsis minnesotensis TaxID=337894 RepID=A0ABP5EE98_9PSEU